MVNAIFITAYTPATIAMIVFTYEWTVPKMTSAVQTRYHDQQLNGFEYENWASQYTFNFILPVTFTCVS
jgi:hypothetical protein